MAAYDSDEPAVPDIFGTGNQSDTDDGGEEEEKWTSANGFGAQSSGGGGDSAHFESVPDGVRFKGLRNQGATCYLNSLLQSLYMTPELREGIYCLTADQLGTAQMEEAEKLDEMVRSKKYKLDETQIAMLESLGISHARVQSKCHRIYPHALLCILMITDPLKA